MSTKMSANVEEHIFQYFNKARELQACGFITSLADTFRRADSFNRALLLPSILLIMQKYPQYLCPDLIRKNVEGLICEMFQI